MSKVRVLFIKHTSGLYDFGISDHYLETVKQVHQCNLVLQVPVTHPLEGVEYPYFEVKTFETKEQALVDSYENEIKHLKKLNTDLSRQIRHLKWESDNKVDKKYKVMFYTFLSLFLFVSIMLYFKL